jgi:hypothetical protein
LIDEHTQPGNRDSGTRMSVRGRTGDAKSEMPSFQFTERGLESLATILWGKSGVDVRGRFRPSRTRRQSGPNSKRAVRFPRVCREQVSRWQQGQG